MGKRVGGTQQVGGKNKASLPMTDVLPLVPHKLPTDSSAIRLPTQK